jgi:hypothetical protein
MVGEYYILFKEIITSKGSICYYIGNNKKLAKSLYYKEKNNLKVKRLIVSEQEKNLFNIDELYETYITSYSKGRDYEKNRKIIK